MVAVMANEIAVEMRIGDLARRGKVTPRTLRYYESLGLLQPVARRSGGFRLYDESAVRRLERIRQLKELLGFSLDEVREILQSEDAVAEIRARYSTTEDAAVRAELIRQALALAAAQREVVRRKLAGLQAMDDEIAERQARMRRALQSIETGPTPGEG
jgi:DNA-binding transcriptional MerR regulator